MSSGQTKGIRKILQKHSAYFSEQIKNIDLCNCSLSDTSFAELLEGLHELEDISSFTYESNELGEESVKWLLDMIRNDDEPNNFRTVNLVSVKTSSRVMAPLLSKLAGHEQLKQLRISDVRLSEGQVFKLVGEIIGQCAQL